MTAVKHLIVAVKLLAQHILAPKDIAEHVQIQVIVPPVIVPNLNVQQMPHASTKTTWHVTMDIISLNNLLQQESHINAIHVQKMLSAPETPYIATQVITKQEEVL